MMHHLQAKIFYPSRPQTYNVTPMRRLLCKPLVRKCYRKFAVNCIRKNTLTNAALVEVIGQDLQREVAAICSDNFNSITRQKPDRFTTACNNVKQALMGELQTKAPTLLTLLKLCLQTRKPRKNTDGVIIMITSLLCKHRRPSACQLQRIISLILYSGHCSKQVSEN